MWVDLGLLDLFLGDHRMLHLIECEVALNGLWSAYNVLMDQCADLHVENHM